MVFWLRRSLFSSSLQRFSLFTLSCLEGEFACLPCPGTHRACSAGGVDADVSSAPMSSNYIHDTYDLKYFTSNFSFMWLFLLKPSSTGYPNARAVRDAFMLTLWALWRWKLPRRLKGRRGCRVVRGRAEEAVSGTAYKRFLNSGILWISHRLLWISITLLGDALLVVLPEKNVQGGFDD